MDYGFTKPWLVSIQSTAKNTIQWDSNVMVFFAVKEMMVNKSISQIDEQIRNYLSKSSLFFSGLGVVVKVEECFIHCPGALKHLTIWETEKWLAKEELPSSREIFLAHLRINGMTLE